MSMQRTIVDCVKAWPRMVAIGLAVSLMAAVAQARITRIAIDAVEPVDGVENYEQITGRAFGEVDPQARLNAIIQDIELAPRNAQGRVEYAMNFRIRRPVSGGNGILFYEVANRGRALSDFTFGGLTLERGYTVVESGWQGDLLQSPGRLTFDAPVATRDGAEITGVMRTEYAVEAPTDTLHLSSRSSPTPAHASYETVDVNDAGATLTRRVREADAREAIPRGDWAFADCTETPFPGVPSSTQICLRGGFQPNFIYELLYTAKNPLVLGLGFAALRDWVSFLRHAEADDEGTPNPVTNTIRTALMHGSSQSGRFVRTFLQLGFNEGEDGGRQVFDGMNPNIAAGRVALNIRFGQPGRSFGQHTEHLFPSYEAPLSWARADDRIAGQDAWFLMRCRMTDTCPKVMSTVTSSEYWRARASLNTTDAEGRQDLPLPPDVRMYLFAGTPHVPPPFFADLGFCQLPPNPHNYFPYMRALLVALEQWVVDDVQPPESQIPTLQDQTLTTSDQASIGWPDIPNVRYTGLVNRLTLLDFGPMFDHTNESGIISEPPSVLEGRDYEVLVPRVDADGNEIAGIRSATIQAPLGTYMGWALRREGFAEDEMCSFQGSFVPFVETRAERVQAGDPRLSLEERYRDHAGYVQAVRRAAQQLVGQRFLLPPDAEAIIAQAEASDVLR